MSLPSEEIPNSISNKTLQAMLATRHGGSLERFQLVPNEEGETRPPSLEDFNDPSFRETMMDMFLQHEVGEPGPAEEREDYKARLEGLVPLINSQPDGKLGRGHQCSTWWPLTLSPTLNLGKR
jgi:hypothetical protein